MLRLLAPLLLLAITSCRWEASTCALPAAPAPQRDVDQTAVFSLPDTGGFLVNGQPIARERVGPLLQELFATRRPADRATFVWAAPMTRCDDVPFLAKSARAAGGNAYDAAGSGWPRPARTRP